MRTQPINGCGFAQIYPGDTTGKLAAEQIPVTNHIRGGIAKINLGNQRHTIEIIGARRRNRYLTLWEKHPRRRQRQPQMANIVTVRAWGPENNLPLGLIQTTGLLHALIGAQPPIAGAAPTQPIGFEHTTEAALTSPITIPSREIRHNYLPHGSQPVTSPIEQLFYALIHLFSVQFVAEKPFIKIRINHHPVERAIDHLRGNTTQPSLLVGEIPHPLVVTTLVRNAPGQPGARTQILGHDRVYAGGVNRAFFFGRGGGH